jgi:IS5 family transposase
VQLVVSKKTKRIICTAHDKGKTHDFKVFTKSKLPLGEKTKLKADSGYQGVQQVHSNSEVPKKSSKHKPLTEKEKAANLKLAKERVVVEHVIGRIKVFRILAERYRNRRTKHTQRVKLICGIYNYQLK